MTRDQLDRRMRGLGRPPTARELDDLRLAGAMDEFSKAVEQAARGDVRGGVAALVGARAQWGSTNVYTAAVLYGVHASTEIGRLTGKAPHKAARRIGDSLSLAAVIEALHPSEDDTA